MLHDMKTYWRIEAYLHAFLASSLYHRIHTTYFPPARKDISVSIVWELGAVRRQSGHCGEKKYLSHLPGIEPVPKLLLMQFF